METNYAAMSDEEISKMDINSLEETVNEQPEQQEEEIPDQEEQEQEEQETVEQPETEENEQEEQAQETIEAKSTDVYSQAETETKEETVQAKPKIDYESEYKKLLSPFKANGKEMQIDSVDDAIQLMQMGANYSKKMSTLKPSLRIIKMLENNNLLDEQKLSFLIDLDKKNPKAIGKLLKDSEIDPIDLEVDNAEPESYTPNRYSVNDKEIELDDVLNTLKESANYSNLLDIVGNQWDLKSRQAIFENPKLLMALNDHMDQGVYKTVMDRVEKERMLGRLGDLSDIEAYKQVGDLLYSNQGNTVQSGNANTTNANNQQQINKRRKAASTTNSNPNKSKLEEVNVLAMSDDEFNKYAEKYLQTI